MLVGCASDDGGAERVEVDGADLGGAVRHTLYVHGRSAAGAPHGWSYWGKVGKGPDPIPVNWGGEGACLAEQNPVVVSAFEEHCTGRNWCYVLCHSAGCAQVEYALDKYGGAAGSANRWNIYWMLAAGSAEGGSELAELSGLTGTCLDHDLRPSVVRSLYNHDNTRGVKIYMYAGAADNFQSVLLPGSDDTVVAYHSAGGARAIGTYVNPAGTAFGKRLDSAPLYSNRVLAFMDERFEYSHPVTASNGGIVSVAEAELVRAAR